MALTGWGALCNGTESVYIKANVKSLVACCFYVFDLRFLCSNATMDNSMHKEM